MKGKIIDALITLVTLYVTASFVMWDFNVINWFLIARLIFVIIFVGLNYLMLKKDE